MEKIRLGKTGMMVSRIGFGGIPIQIEPEDEAVGVIHRVLDKGINYIDTAPAYTNSEERVGKALAHRNPRPFIATKTSPTPERIKDNLNQSLKTLGIPHLDIYQFHNVSDFKTYDAILAPNGGLSILQEAKTEGLIKHISISSHQIDVARAAIRSGLFDTLLYPFNFITCEAAEELVPLAREHDVGFIAMKAFAGGRITNISLAIKYLLQFPDVLILPGIGKVKEADEILKVLDDPELSPDEDREIKRIRKETGNRFCRHCDYCQPCPQGIPVSYVLDFEPLKKSFPRDSFYSSPMAGAIKTAASCDNCGECEKKCPYNVPVREMLAEYVRLFGEGINE